MADYEEIQAEDEETNLYTAPIRFLELYGWYLVIVCAILGYLYSKVHPKVMEYKRKKEEFDYNAIHHKDPDVVSARLLAQAEHTRRLQERYNRDAEVYQQKLEEKENKKREDWLARHQDPNGGGKKLGKLTKPGQRQGNRRHLAQTGHILPVQGATALTREAYTAKLQEKYAQDAERYKAKLEEKERKKREQWLERHKHIDSGHILGSVPDARNLGTRPAEQSRLVQDLQAKYDQDAREHRNKLEEKEKLKKEQSIDHFKVVNAGQTLGSGTPSAAERSRLVRQMQAKYDQDAKEYKRKLEEKEARK